MLIINQTITIINLKSAKSVDFVVRLPGKVGSWHQCSLVIVSEKENPQLYILSVIMYVDLNPCM